MIRPDPESLAAISRLAALIRKRPAASGAAAAVICACLWCSIGCAPGLRNARESNPVRLPDVIQRAYAAAAQDAGFPRPMPPGLPEYFKALIADGVLTVGFGIGTPDLAPVSVSPSVSDRSFSSTVVLFNREIQLHASLVLTRSQFAEALSACEIIFVTSHSRFGAGPVFFCDGKARPFRMQQTPGYEIVMPDAEVCGYDGTVYYTFNNPLKTESYTVFAPDSTELDSANPYHGYQLIVLSTCSSRKHFEDEIASFRAGYPTTAVFTTRPCCMDTKTRMFSRLLYELFQARPMPAVVSGLNEQYRAIAWENVQDGRGPWEIIDRLYEVGINTMR